MLDDDEVVAAALLIAEKEVLAVGRIDAGPVRLGLAYKFPVPAPAQ